ncbi:methylmalonyl-CoA mutase family protein [Leptospira borgpetersenii]|uniref:Fused isobutyryl-CoA mutase n=2 Tax=Leptospira borgpetersenii TaxID=174 RepID=M6W721_LEPBO|nr:methylmalonyl-CoA mutase family protein [Leptospira borgpetersenii]EMO64925.1 methylmalonyl-CoA mutase [Leptospira borgpetersenii serovar Pomona str. 200901868]AXX15439.1 methylmalonyl-CoA mutase [Leptospira borgpetersenii serovar Ceylonica]EKQ91340.1 methylmalonyl-CoA mutase [Leptospira borgpetersenii str. UI 09149]EMN56386.1 methylmalonyl-CoA mutase [Leptospira borgpetersenii serovar Javanica str. MK146]EPG59414.1 methylmalonyl-CoA mutase [Leptospira borgpetersenii serovar Javanica str. U
METQIYTPKHKVRFITAASLFDGHDASINIMRRILQASGVEVIHLGHNRSVKEIVECAIQEDAQGIAITSYQGGHVEYFKYMIDLLKEKGAGHIKVFGGGGGTILPLEIKELETYGVTRIYSPDDGRELGLQGMINDLIRRSDFVPPLTFNGTLHPSLRDKNPLAIAQSITLVENTFERQELEKSSLIEKLNFPPGSKAVPILGITGTGGAGKSSLTDELVRRFLIDFPDKSIAILSVDPSKRKTGGALLGDRIRMNSIFHKRVYMRSFATREANIALNKNVKRSIDVLKCAGFDLIIVETAGIGQSDSEITEVADIALYVMTPEYGAATQLEKIDMIDYADLIAINKFDKRGALDALRDVKKQFQRSRQLFDRNLDTMPVFGTIASQFNDPGTNLLYGSVIRSISEKLNLGWSSSYGKESGMSEKIFIIPPDRVRYLAEIREECRRYDQFTEEESDKARKLFQLFGAIEVLKSSGQDTNILKSEYSKIENSLSPETKKILSGWEEKLKNYQGENFTYKVRDKEIQVSNTSTSLSNLKIPKVAVPKFKDWGEIVRWSFQENFPGEFPFTAGVFPFKRTGEDPTRMFAGEGGPERTNARFHYVSLGMPAQRLSTAFDSVTLYGEDPGERPDIYGKIGNSGVSIATLDDAKKLYSGFDLCNPTTSVSMTINGPAPMILAFFMNTAIDQACEKHIKSTGSEKEVRQKIEAIYKIKNLPVPIYNAPIPQGNEGLGLLLLGVTGDEVLEREVYEKIKQETLKVVRGTVQADILKEDQAQNTCIFSTEFALKMMGDIQEYFITNQVRNFYSVSISGYHIAEAGANPITQVAFTLANGLTYVEYFLSRGMKIDDFAPNLSFFFSNGIDPEYAVIGRVARKIWAKAVRHKYGANDRSAMLKYHIQTSGRSLHAQEIAFNDIRTTLQALYAIYDNCNSLHTNAYDEAITTPTEESVRRAMAIQLIINRELGLAKNENPGQGSFIIEELTDLVEQAILQEFYRISERGGVLGAMEMMYQRNKIQEESLYYESLKHNGEFPVIGVNTFLSKEGSPTIIPEEVIRSTDSEKQTQIGALREFQKRNEKDLEDRLRRLKSVSLSNGNIFGELMETSKKVSLGQMTHALYEVGGQYRRSM